MTRTLNIFTDNYVPRYFFSEIKTFLLNIFPFSDITFRDPIDLPEKCWNAFRYQYEAKCLLSIIQPSNSRDISLLVISQDIYVPNLNFVFGVAAYGLGAVVSTIRLEKDIDFLYKEIIHELGHVYGLKHCSLPCVMTFSNSVYEAKMKTSIFCKTCSQKIKPL